MIDASKGFIKDGNKNRLRAQDIHRHRRQPSPARSKSRATPGWSRWSRSAIRRTTFNLKPSPRTSDSTEPEDIQEHRWPLARRHPRARHRCARPLLGGCCRRCGPLLFKSANSSPAIFHLKLSSGRRQSCHLQPPGVHRVQRHGHRTLCGSGRPPTGQPQRDQTRRSPEGADQRRCPRTCWRLSATPRLLDAYDVYQHLMDYWAEKTMQDDLYLIAQARLDRCRQASA